MMFIPTEGAYLLAIQSDANLWEYAYNKKVVLMSPTNLISALRLSLDLWKRENQVKNVQAIIKRGTVLYEKIAGFTDTFLTLGDRMDSLAEGLRQSPQPALRRQRQRSAPGRNAEGHEPHPEEAHLGKAAAQRGDTGRC